MEVNVISRILGLDIDSTIWPAEDRIEAACAKLYGMPFGDEWLTHTQLVEKFGEGYRRIFELALAPHEVEGRPLYPGVADAILELYGMGVSVHFISKNHTPERMRRPLKRWLNDRLDIPFGLSLTTTDEKLHLLRKVNAFGMVDDRLDLILRVADRGLFAAARAHPWNAALLDMDTSVRRFSDWEKLPSMVDEFLRGG